jgi:hypothetical protein
MSLAGKPKLPIYRAKAHYSDSNKQSYIISHVLSCFYYFQAGQRLAYLGTYGGKSYTLYLNVVHCFNTRVN